MHEFTKFSRRRIAAALAILWLGAGVASALADTITISASAAGTQTADATSNIETFDNMSYNGTSYTTSFGGSSYTGTYTGSLSIQGANPYGGAGGTGQYAVVSEGNSYTLTLDHGANFFGVWISALDSSNWVQFYSGSTLLYTFGASNMTNLLGACPGSAYCDNPNAAFAGQDPNELFAYLNFYDSVGTFDSIVFSETGYGAFESDNQSVAYLNSAPTQMDPTPEPATLVFSLTGLAGLLLLPRQRLRAQRIAARP